MKLVLFPLGAQHLFINIHVQQAIHEQQAIYEHKSHRSFTTYASPSHTIKQQIYCKQKQFQGIELFLFKLGS